MTTCNYCNHETQNDRICTYCGFFVSPEVKSDATSDESITVLTNLKKRYIDKLISYEDEAQRAKSRRNGYNTHLSRHSFMRFFWPTFLALVFIPPIILLIVLALTNNYTAQNIALFVSYPVVLIAGIFIAKLRYDRKNAEIYRVEEENIKRQQEYRNQELEAKERAEKVYKNLSLFNSVIPVKYLNQKTINTMINSIKTGKAKNFDEALENESFQKNF